MFTPYALLSGVLVFFHIATKHLNEMLLKDDVPKTNTDVKKTGNLFLTP